MRKLIAVAALAVVAACSQEAATEADAPEEVAEAPAAAMAADGGTPYGSFKVTLADGSVLTEEVHEDGTYISTSASGEQRKGTWVQKGDQYCTTSNDEGATERCHTESINDEGVWISTDPDGETATIQRVEPIE